MTEHDDRLPMHQMLEHAREAVEMIRGRSRVELQRPDFLVKLRTGTMLVLEVKGQVSPQNQAKRAALDEWTRAVTAHGGFGQWRWAVSRAPSDIVDLVRAATQ